MIKSKSATLPLKVTVPVEASVSSCRDKVLPDPLTAPEISIAAEPEFKLLSTPSDTAPNEMASLLVLMLPPKVVVLAVLVKPPLKVNGYFY